MFLVFTNVLNASFPEGNVVVVGGVAALVAPAPPVMRDVPLAAVVVNKEEEVVVVVEEVVSPSGDIASCGDGARVTKANITKRMRFIQTVVGSN
jgi:hypothetical protein